MARLKLKDRTAWEILQMGFALVVLGLFILPPVIIVGGLMFCWAMNSWFGIYF